MVELGKRNVTKELTSIIDYMETSKIIHREFLLPEWVRNTEHIMVYRYGYIFLEMSYLMREIINGKRELILNKEEGIRLLLETINFQHEESIFKCLRSLIYKIYMYELKQDISVTTGISGMHDLLLDYMIEEGILYGDSSYEPSYENELDIEIPQPDILVSVANILADGIGEMDKSQDLRADHAFKPVNVPLLSLEASYISYELACFLVAGIEGYVKVMDPTVFKDISLYFENKNIQNVQELKESVKDFLYEVCAFKRHEDSLEIRMDYSGMDYLLYRMFRVK